MLNYENEIMNLLSGDTPAAKYKTLSAILEMMVNITTPRRGSVEENWTTYDVAKHISDNNLLKTPQD